MKNGLKEFLRPTCGKLILPLIFIFILVSLFIPFVGIFAFIILFFLFLPFRPILERLGLWETGPMYFDMAPGPSLPSLFLISIVYVIVLYLISCVVAYKAKQKSG